MFVYVIFAQKTLYIVYPPSPIVHTIVWKFCPVNPSGCGKRVEKSVENPLESNADALQKFFLDFSDLFFSFDLIKNALKK